MTDIEIKVKDRNCWAIKTGYLDWDKWYNAKYSDDDLFVILPADNDKGHCIYIFKHHVEVRESLKLEVGKKYVTKGGIVVGPMVESDVSFTDEYGNKSKYMDECDWHYSENGRFIYGDEEDCENIVSEYVEEFQTIELKVDANKSLETYARIFSESLEESKHNPVEEVTVKRLKAGTYGRLKLSTDGYHAINISVVDGGRTWSKDDIEQAIETLTKIKDAR